MSTSVKIDERLESYLCSNITFALRRVYLLGEVVVGIDVGVVVHLVVKLHNPAIDRGLEGAIVVFAMNISRSKPCIYLKSLHGRSGSVALPRVKLKPPMPALLELAEVPARRAARAVVVRSIVTDIVYGRIKA